MRPSIASWRTLAFDRARTKLDVIRSNRAEVTRKVEAERIAHFQAQVDIEQALENAIRRATLHGTTP